MKRLNIILILILSMVFVCAETKHDQFIMSMVFSGYKNMEKKNIPREKIISRLLEDFKKTNMTETDIEEIMALGEKEKWVAQDLEMNRVNAAALNGRGNPKQGIKELDLIIQDLLRDSPERKELIANAYYYQSSLYNQIDDLKQRDIFLSKAIELDDQNRYRVYRASSRFGLGDDAGCDEDMAVVEKRAPNDPYYLKYKEKIARWRKIKAEKAAQNKP